MASAHPGKLETVEAGRGLAALAVVFFHANTAGFGGPQIPLLTLGEHGVDFFFVLSGFIIFFNHRRDIGQPEAARSYAWKRAIRLFPLLWIVVLGWSAMKWAGGEPPAPDKLFTSVTLLPPITETIPTPVWTLRHEALFYVAFLVLILNRVAGLALFGLWSAAVLVQFGLSLAGRPVEGLPAFFLSTYTLDFLFGAAIGLLPRPKPSWWPFILSALIVIAVLWIEEAFNIGRKGTLDYSSPGAVQWTPVLGLAFAGLLYGLLAIESLVRVPRVLVMLGAASYAIYLCHNPVMAVIQQVSQNFFLYIIAGTAAGFILHFYIDKPIGDRLRAILLPRRQLAAAE